MCSDVEGNATMNQCDAIIMMLQFVREKLNKSIITIILIVIIIVHINIIPIIIAVIIIISLSYSSCGTITVSPHSLSLLHNMSLAAGNVVHQ